MMPNLADRICGKLPGRFWETRSIIAVSGGGDSVAMLLALHQASLNRAKAGFQLHVAHFDHQWQPNSAEVAKFVEGICSRLKIDCHVQDADSIIAALNLEVTGRPPRLSKHGIEATARVLRYRFFQSLSQSIDATYLLTGHTCDDQSETVLMRIARGTSISGLAGIGQRRPLTESCDLLRPMLEIPRQTLADYLKALQQPFWQDSSNEDNQLTRNRTRNIVLPWLRENLSPAIDGSLLNLQQSALDIQTLQDFVFEQFRNALVSMEEESFQVDTSQLASVPEPIVRQLLVRWWQLAKLPAMEMTREHWIRLTRLVVRPSPSSREPQPLWPSQFHFPGPVVAKRKQRILTVQRLDSAIK